MNLAYKLFETSKNFKDSTAFIANDQKISFSDLWEKVSILSNAFEKLGVKEGTKVAIILPNCIEYIYSFFALLKINAILVPIEPIYNIRTYREIFQENCPNAVITNSNIILNTLLFDNFLLKDRKLITVDSSAWIKENFPKAVAFEALFKIGKPNDDFKNLSSDLTCCIIHTYKGLGYPIGVEITSGNLYAGVLSLTDMAKDAKNFLLILPMAHIFGLLSTAITPLLRGDRIIIPKNNSSDEIFSVIEKYQINFFVGVPTLFLYLMNSFDDKKHNLKSLKYCISGGNFLSRTKHKIIEKKMGINIFQGYGLTEALIVSCNLYDNNKPGTLGQIRPGIKVKIVNDSLTEVKIGKKGEIMIGGPTVMRGYHNRKKETNEALVDGWLFTGDYGFIDKSGNLNFIGLKKKIAKISGHNVDLLEIERVLKEHPNVEDVKAYAKDDFIWGQKIGIDVKVKKEISKEEILIFCQKNFVTFQIPKIINFKN